ARNNVRNGRPYPHTTANTARRAIADAANPTAREYRTGHGQSGTRTRLMSLSCTGVARDAIQLASSGQLTRKMTKSSSRGPPGRPTEIPLRSPAGLESGLPEDSRAGWAVASFDGKLANHTPTTSGGAHVCAALL